MSEGLPFVPVSELNQIKEGRTSDNPKADLDKPKDTPVESLHHYIVAFDIDRHHRARCEAVCQEARGNIERYVTEDNRKGIRLSESCYLFRSKAELSATYEELFLICPNQWHAVTKLSVTEVACNGPNAHPMRASDVMSNEVLVGQEGEPSPETLAVAFGYFHLRHS